MSKAATKQVSVGEMSIHMPVGSMDRPTAIVDTIANAMMNKSNWKLPTASPYVTNDLGKAQDVAYGLDWYLGGHEISKSTTGEFVVTSKGYYHYIGA